MEIDGTTGDVADNAAPAGNDDASGGNPAWQELYEVLPTNLHTLVAPVLEKWEQGTQTKFNEYAEKQKSFEPYQGFVENNVPADRIEQSLAIAQLIDSDPQGFLEQMQAFYGPQQTQQTQQQPNQQQTTQGENDSFTFDEKPFDLNSTPEFQQIKEQQDLIAQVLTQQFEAERAQQEDAQLDQELQTLTEKYGEFDNDYVFGLALNGVPLEKAVEQYHSLVENIRNRPAADANLPSIVTPGGSMPSERIDPANMSDAQRKAFVMNALAQASKT